MGHLTHHGLTASKERTEGFESTAGAYTVHLHCGAQRAMADASQSRSLPDEAFTLTTV